MRITTLGTSHGNPTCCRFNSSMLLETCGRLYLVDAGEPVTSQLIRANKDLDALKAVFITHMHNDHVGGLDVLVKTLVKYPSEGKHVSIFMPESKAIQGLEEWLRFQHVCLLPEIVSLREIRPGSIYADEAIEVIAEPTGHVVAEGNHASFAYLVKADGKRFVFTGDLKPDFSDFPDAAKNYPCDVCVCEATHYPMELALPVLMQARIEKLIFTHIGDQWHGLDGESALKNFLRRLPFPAVLARDGDVFNL